MRLAIRASCSRDPFTPRINPNVTKMTCAIPGYDWRIRDDGALGAGYLGGCHPCKSPTSDLLRVAAVFPNPQKMPAASDPVTNTCHLNLQANQLFAKCRPSALHPASYNRAVWQTFPNTFRPTGPRTANFLYYQEKQIPRPLVKSNPLRARPVGQSNPGTFLTSG